MTVQDRSVHSRKHFVEIDYLRCFAILAVIAIHTAAALTRIENPADFYVVSLWQDIASFAVPLFICISGFVFFAEIKETHKFLRYVFLALFLTCNFSKPSNLVKSISFMSFKGLSNITANSLAMP